jgi:hypothetical protein
MTMRDHFDMEEVFQHLVTMDENKGKTRVSGEIFLFLPSGC